MRFHGRPADVIWCYFGHDEVDIIRSNHFAYTIWAEDVRLRETYYRKNRNAEIIDDIYVFWNTSYQVVKGLQESKSSEEEIITEYRKLSNMLIAHAESFIKDMEEVENGNLSIITVKTANQGWVQEVRQLYYKLTEAEPAPVRVHDWVETILEMAGWVVDLAVFMENDIEHQTERTSWLMKQSICRYQLSLVSISSGSLI